MVFSVNAKLEGDKTMAQFKQLAINKNGTEQAPLSDAPIQSVPPGAAAAPSTVTIEAGAGQGVQATGTHAPPAVATTGTHAPGAAATVVPGQGTFQGGACTCQCLCGENAFPAQAAINNFGGFAGAMVGFKA